MDVKKYIKDNTIIDKETIRVAKSMPKSAPDSFLRPLIPIGIARFTGDNMPGNWSCNSHFKIGETYPIYDSENGPFPISTNTGVGMKMTPKAWTVEYF